MKWTKGRLREKGTIEFFWPINSVKEPIAVFDSDWEAFFDISERGKQTKKPSQSGMIENGYDLILEGKRWRDIHMNMWQDGVLEGTVPYFCILGGENGDSPIPRSVVDFMKRDMFGGIDADTIEKTYKKILDDRYGN